jgi:hypothetical protein
VHLSASNPASGIVAIETHAAPATRSLPQATTNDAAPQATLRASRRA